METVYRSRSHPGAVPRSVLLGSSLVRPLGASMLPVMLAALVSMLTGNPPLVWLYAGFPVALIVATGWTVFQLRRQVAEITIREEAVRVRSTWEVASRLKGNWLSVLDVRRQEETINLTLGHDSRLLSVRDWEAPDRLEEALRSARDTYSHRTLGRDS